MVTHSRDNASARQAALLKEIVARHESIHIKLMQVLADTWFDLGNLSFMANTEEANDEAIKAFTGVTMVTPDDPRGWMMLEKILRRTGDVAGADLALEQLLPLS